jgi:hypothetical protein
MWATKDIPQENKKSISLFLLKYYHNLNSFSRDDALCLRNPKLDKRALDVIVI